MLFPTELVYNSIEWATLTSQRYWITGSLHVATNNNSFVRVRLSFSHTVCPLLLPLISIKLCNVSAPPPRVVRLLFSFVCLSVCSLQMIPWTVALQNFILVHVLYRAFLDCNSVSVECLIQTFGGLSLHHVTVFVCQLVRKNVWKEI